MIHLTQWELVLTHPEGILDVFHAPSKGIVAGANMVLVDFHPQPTKALVDGPQALLMTELDHFLEDVEISRQAYLQRKAYAKKIESANENKFNAGDFAFRLSS